MFLRPDSLAEPRYLYRKDYPVRKLARRLTAIIATISPITARSEIMRLIRPSL